MDCQVTVVGGGGPNAKKEWLEGEACFLLGGVLLDGLVRFPRGVAVVGS